MDTLDAPARTFLAVARLASAEEHHQHHSRSTLQACARETLTAQHRRKLGTSPPFLASPSSLSLLQPQQGPQSPAAAEHPPVGRGKGPASSWRASVGLLPGLNMVGLMHAAASGCQAALLGAALPHVAWAAAAEGEQARHAQDGRGMVDM